MNVGGRTINRAHFIGEINDGHGTLMVERFLLKGPIRMWWTEDNAYEIFPYSLEDWFTMADGQSFDAVGGW